MRRRLASAGRHGSLITLAVVMLIPVYLVLINAFKSNADITSNPFGVPWSRLSIDTLIEVLTDSSTNILSAYGFSILVTVLSVTGVVVLGSMIAYSIARLDRRTTRAMFIFLVAGMLVPAVVVLIPVVRILQFFQLMFTFPGLILFNIAFGLPFAVLLYTGFIRSIPVDLDHAAWIDGAGPMRTFWNVVFPLLKPVTATVGIFLALGYWNDFITPLVILGPGEGYTITTGMYRSIGLYTTDYSSVFSWLWLGTVPILVLFVIFQRWMIAGLLAGSTKG